MNRTKVRVLLVKDTDTHKEVYGQLIDDDVYADENDPLPSTDEVVRAYMREFCSTCYTYNNRLDNGVLSNDFKGRVAVVSEEIGGKEYAVVVKILNRPLDNDEIFQYNDKNFQWNAAAELDRGRADPRVYEEEKQAKPSFKDWCSVFATTFNDICLAMLIVGLFKLFVGGHNKSE